MSLFTPIFNRHSLAASLSFNKEDTSRFRGPISSHSDEFTHGGDQVAILLGTRDLGTLCSCLLINRRHQYMQESWGGLHGRRATGQTGVPTVPRSLLPSGDTGMHFQDGSATTHPREEWFAFLYCFLPWQISCPSS